MRRLPLKKWTEDIALRETNERMRKIEQLLGEVAYLWGDVDQYIVDRADAFAREIADVRLDFVLQVQARAEERAAEALCDCQHPEETAGGFRAVSVDCPIHGDRR